MAAFSARTGSSLLDTADTLLLAAVTLTAVSLLLNGGALVRLHLGGNAG